MNETAPNPRDAHAALDEASRRAELMRRADHQFRPVLLVVAGLYLATGALLSANPRGGNVLISYALLILFLGGLAGGIYLILRIRAYSRAGIFWFLGSVAAFLLWNGAVIWASIATGWWGPHQSGIHFGGSVVAAVIPLFVAAWLIGRR